MDFKQKISALLADAAGSKTDFFSLIEVPPTTEMGDFALPCFQLAKEFKKPPYDLARDIVEKIKVSKWLTKVEAKGPYVNFFISKNEYNKEILAEIMQEKDNYGHAEIGKGKSIIIDFSSPNIAKPFSIAHLRSTAIGNSIYNVYKFLGYKCIGINHLGDWGLQFGKLIVAFRLWGDRQLLKKEPIKHLYELYVRFHSEVENDINLETEARAWFCKLESGDNEALKIWKEFRELSLKEFKKIYKMLGVKFDSYTGEAYYNQLLPSAIKLLEEKRLTEISEGALVVKLENMPPCIIRKTDEASLYATRDIAAAIDRYNKYHFEQAIYVVDMRQSLHFEQFFKVLDMAGFEWANKLRHVPFGLMRFKEETMSTRKGKLIFLEDVLGKAKQEVLSIIKAKNPELKSKEKIAEIVGIGAILFWDLVHDRIKDIEFDWKKLLDFEGETGPYVQYTYARARSILKKAKQKPTLLVNYFLLDAPEEARLIRTLGEFGERIRDSALQYKPSIIARYALEVAQCFNEFYHSCKCTSSDVAIETRKARLLLVSCTAHVIRNALGLLGIKAPEEM